MFKGIVAERGRCDHCRQQHLLAHIPPTLEGEPYEVDHQGGVLKLCSKCIYALTRLAALLAMFDRPATSGKAKKAPKKARKLATSQPRPIAPPSDESDHEPVLGDRELAEREL